MENKKVSIDLYNQCPPYFNFISVREGDKYVISFGSTRSDTGRPRIWMFEEIWLKLYEFGNRELSLVRTKVDKYSP